MTRGQLKERPHGAHRVRLRWLTQLVAIPLFLVLTSSVAWAYWFASSVPGGNGAAAATSVNPGATPTTAVTRSSVTVSWAATTLATGQAVTGYQLTRYDAGTAAVQTILSPCAGTISATTCIERSVPIGSWKYTVTPVFATNWKGTESAKSNAVTVSVKAPELTLTPTTTKPDRTLTGTAAGFVGGETLVYRLDDPTTGTVLTGKLNGSPTPATVPAGWGGLVSVTVPAGTSDGAHTVYAVTSPSGENAAAAIVVDGTAPVAPTITSGPFGTTGSDVWISFTGEAGATFGCAMDNVWSNCTSPVFYGALTDGSHTFQVESYDLAVNYSTTSSTWTVDATVDATGPTINTTFPALSAHYQDTTYNAGCGTPGTGDVCGTTTPAGSAVSTVEIAVMRHSTGLWLTGGTFSSASKVWVTATGTASWSYAHNAATFPAADDTYTLLVRATDAAAKVRTATTVFSIDRVAPAAPSITRGAYGTTGPDVWIRFTGEAGSTFECRLDAGAWVGCTSEKDYSALTNGSHTFNVRAVDGGGTSATTSSTWTVDATYDNTPPTIGVTFPAFAGYYQNTTYNAGCGTPGTGDICGTTSDAGNLVSKVEIAVRNSGGLYLSGGTFSSPSPVWLTATGTTSWNYALGASTALSADDSYSVEVRATDAVGNSSETNSPWDMDRTAPIAPTITSGASGTTGPNPSISFTGEVGATFECSLDAGGWAGCTSPKNYSALTNGSHTFHVRATDAVGNTGATTHPTWTVDAIAPTAVGFTTTNKSGGTVGKLELGDTFTLAYSEAIAPASIISGWDGLAPRNVVVRATNSVNDTLTIWNDINGSQLPLGSVNLKGNYVNPTMTFGLAGSATRSTITWNGTSFTVTLGTANGTVVATAVTTKPEAIWTSAAGATDIFGNVAVGNIYTQPDNLNDF